MRPSKPFHHLAAADIMSRELWLIPDDMSAQEAARLLVQHRISGAPVVDCRRVLVGVVSCADFVREMTKADSSHLECGSADCVYSDWQVVDIDSLTTDAVRNCMTADPVAADENTPIADLAQMMVDAQVHRVVIVDSDYSPIGIVTTTDILGAVSRISNEPAVVSETGVDAAV
jgi:CBS-domain-containing membrane protein